MSSFVDKAIDDIKGVVGEGKCVVGLSGGVDSSVAAALVGRAIGHNLAVVYVDTGLMRQGETEQVRDTFNNIGVDLRVVDAKERFLEGIKGITDPEQKRKIIGRLFAIVFEEEATRINADYLVQGTIYPDRVESGRVGKSAVIKTHHNVGGLPEDIKFNGVIEPLRELYKDEVRALARELGLSEQIAQRQPFPGPGLALRIIGEITAEKLDIVRKADYIVTSGLEKAGIRPWQYFAVLTDIKTTGVRGDDRVYSGTVALRVVESRDGMTARFMRVPWDVLEIISTKITNDIPEVNRVVYDITHKPPGTIEWQ